MNSRFPKEWIIQKEKCPGHIMPGNSKQLLEISPGLGSKFLGFKISWDQNILGSKYLGVNDFKTIPKPWSMRKMSQSVCSDFEECLIFVFENL